MLDQTSPRVAYRYEDRSYANMPDEHGRETGSTLRVERFQYEVTKTTPQGFWIEVGYNHRRFVRTSARKQFACLTDEEARKSFLARKNRQKQILQSRLDQVLEAMVLIATIPCQTATPGDTRPGPNTPNTETLAPPPQAPA